MDARTYLKKVGKIDKLIENKMVEIEQWRALAEGTSASASGERVQTSKNLKKMEDAVIRIEEIRSEINEITQTFIDYKQEVIETIERLDANYYDVLHKTYIQGMQEEEIAAIYHKTVRSVNRTKGKALKKVQEILNERGKHG